jgi:hypothetical protein
MQNVLDLNLVLHGAVHYMLGNAIGVRTPILSAGFKPG